MPPDSDPGATPMFGGLAARYNQRNDYNHGYTLSRTGQGVSPVEDWQGCSGVGGRFLLRSFCQAKIKP